MGRIGRGELAYMWGELVGASWHTYGASWLGRVGFGANRLAPVPMTRQYHDNWLRIDLEIKENRSPRCESDYNIGLRPVGSEKVAISPLFSKSTHQTRHIHPMLV